MAGEAVAPPRTPTKDVLTAVAAAFVVTLVAALAVFPFALESLAALPPLGSFGLSALFPILCDVYVARRFFAKRSPVSRGALVATGTVFSFAFAFLVWGGFILAVTG